MPGRRQTGKDRQGAGSEGIFAFFPSNGRPWSRPQNEVGKRGLTRQIRDMSGSRKEKTARAAPRVPGAFVGGRSMNRAFARLGSTFVTDEPLLRKGEIRRTTTTFFTPRGGGGGGGGGWGGGGGGGGGGAPPPLFPRRAREQGDHHLTWLLPARLGRFQLAQQFQRLRRDLVGGVDLQVARPRPPGLIAAQGVLLPCARGSCCNRWPGVARS